MAIAPARDFGSHATGDQRPDSDVDLAVLPPRGIDPLERWHLQERLASLLHKSVDLIDLRQATTVMRTQVVTTGTLFMSAPLGRGRCSKQRR